MEAGFHNPASILVKHALFSSPYTHLSQGLIIPGPICPEPNCPVLVHLANHYPGYCMIFIRNTLCYSFKPVYMVNCYETVCLITGGKGEHGTDDSFSSVAQKADSKVSGCGHHSTFGNSVTFRRSSSGREWYRHCT